MTTRRNRGSLMIELILIAVVIVVLGGGASVVFGHAVRVRMRTEIGTANINALATEVKRLRSLPLEAFYQADGVTVRPSLTYFRRLSLPGSSTTTNVFAQVDIRVAPVSIASGPVQVFIECRPRYIANGVTSIGTDGLGTSSGAAATAIPNGLDLSDLAEAETFIVL